MARPITTALRTIRRITPVSFIAGTAGNETLANTRQNLVAHLPIGLKPLLAAAFHRGRIGGRPVFPINPLWAGQCERPGMRPRRRPTVEGEIESLPIVQFFEG